MQENREVEKKTPRSGAGNKQRTVRYSFEFRLKAVKLPLEEGFAQELVWRDMGLGTSTISGWLKSYRERGQDGLRSLPPPGGWRRQGALAAAGAGDREDHRTQGAEPVVGHQAHRAQVLRRMFPFQASPETVRTRPEAGLMNQPRAAVRARQPA